MLSVSAYFQEHMPVQKARNTDQKGDMLTEAPYPRGVLCHDKQQLKHRVLMQTSQQL
jgi:hypothetical protein